MLLFMNLYLHHCCSVNLFTLSYHLDWQSEWRPRDYMGSQPEINEKMRLILVEWLIDVHVKFELNPETFYLTVNILDRFLSVKPVPRKELQLVGLSALLMSSKYEEIWPPQVIRNRELLNLLNLILLVFS